MTIGIVEDHELYLEGICLLLEKHGIHIAFTASNGQSALEKLQAHIPDVLICDIHLPDLEPETLLTKIRDMHPQLPVLYLTLMRGTRHLHKLLRQSIQGYVLKNAPVQVLLDALETIYKGGNYFSKEIGNLTDSDEFRNTVTVPENKVETILTKREIEILQLICREHTNQQIAEQLFLSVGTVDTHRKNIIQKLGVNNTVGLVRYAYKQGLID
jgi:two-component system, NarL family, response regulator NreC